MKLLTWSLFHDLIRKVSHTVPSRDRLQATPLKCAQNSALNPWRLLLLYKFQVPHEECEETVKNIYKKLKRTIDIQVTHIKDERKEDDIVFFFDADEITVDIPDIGYLQPGWKIAGFVDYDMSKSKKGIVSVLDDKFVEEVMKYQSIDNARCDYCATKRIRKSVIVVYKEESKDFHVLGRDCFQYFLGVTRAKELEKQLSAHRLIREMCNSSPPFNYTFKQSQIIELALYFIEKYGYKDSSKPLCYPEPLWASNTRWSNLSWSPIAPKNNKICTAQKIYNYLFNKREPIILEKYSEESKTILAYLKNQTTFNRNYFFAPYNLYHKVTFFLDSDCIGARDFDSLISMIYLAKYMLSDKKNEYNNEFFGCIKNRYTLELTLHYSKHIQLSWLDTRTLYVFSDIDGRCFKWFNTGHNECDIEWGEKGLYNVTIKDHLDSSGRKQTLLERVRLKRPMTV